jgi:single-stranded DNA-binding protein
MNGIEAAFCGRVTSESIELKTSKTTKVWAAFNVAIGTGDNVQWARIAVFEDLAERLAGELKKGDRIYCEGTLRLESWSDKKTGEPRSGLSVAAWRVEKLGQIGRSKPRRAKAIAAANGQPVPDGAHDWQCPPADAIPI